MILELFQVTDERITAQNVSFLKISAFALWLQCAICLVAAYLSEFFLLGIIGLFTEAIVVTILFFTIPYLVAVKLKKLGFIVKESTHSSFLLKFSVIVAINFVLGVTGLIVFLVLHSQIALLMILALYGIQLSTLAWAFEYLQRQVALKVKRGKSMKKQMKIELEGGQDQNERELAQDQKDFDPLETVSLEQRPHVNVVLE